MAARFGRPDTLLVPALAGPEMTGGFLGVALRLKKFG